MKLENFGRAFLALALASLLQAAGGPACADDAPPAPAPPVPTAPPAPAAPPTPPTPPLPEDFLGAWWKKKPIPAPAWRDATIVESLFAQALDAVETACGAKFGKRPTVRISTKAEVDKVVRAEFASLRKSLGLQDLSPLMLEAIAAALTAKYDIEGHVVLVVPENVETCSALCGVDLGTQDVLRVALAHECTHALDFERFHWAESRRGVSTELEFKAFGAIVEGHAQFVAKRVAAQWKLSDAFEVFTKAIGAVPEGVPEFLQPVLRAMTSEGTFAYWEGAAFLESVLAEAGEEGVLRALEHPPKTTREIEHPAEWLHPDRTTVGLDLAPVLAALEPLVPRPAWNAQSADVLEGTVRGQLADLPPEEVKAALEAFQSAKVLVANRVGSTEMFVVLGMRFSTEAQAKAFAALDRRASEAKDAKLATGPMRVKSAHYVDGAGTGGKWPGCTIEKVITLGPLSVTASVSVLAAGTFAFEIALSGREVERAWMDRVVDALAAYVVDPDHPVPAMPADAALKVPEAPDGFDVEHRKSVPMLVVGPDGKPVPRARISVMYEVGVRNLTLECPYKDGSAELPLEAAGPALLIYAAADETGSPLGFGPLYIAHVDVTAKDLKFELPPGLALEGRVVDVAGKGVEGVRVRASHVLAHAEGSGGPAMVGIASARTDAEGRYRLTGLGKRTQLFIEPPPPLAGPNPIVFEGTGPVPDVAVAEGLSAIVTVVDSDGKPLVDATVRWARLARPEPGTTIYHWADPQSSTDASGRATLAGLPRGGEFALSVTPPAGRENLGSFDDRAWNGRDVEVKLQRVQRIVGRVVDERGEPVPDATVHLKSSGRRVSTAVEPDGTFSFDDVEIGSVSVGATRGRRSYGQEPTRWIPALPESPVEIVVGAPPILLSITIRGLAAGRTVYVRQVGEDTSWSTFQAAAGGVVLVPNLAAGAHVDVYVEPTKEDPRSLAAPGVESSPKGITLDLVEGVSSKGTLRATMKYQYLEVHVVAPWGPMPIEVAPDATFETPPLPPGKYEVRAKARGTDAWIYARAAFEPGAVLDLELRPK